MKEIARQWDLPFEYASETAASDSRKGENSIKASQKKQKPERNMYSGHLGRDSVLIYPSEGNIYLISGGLDREDSKLVWLSDATVYVCVPTTRELGDFPTEENEDVRTQPRMRLFYVKSLSVPKKPYMPIGSDVTM